MSDFPKLITINTDNPEDLDTINIKIKSIANDSFTKININQQSSYKTFLTLEQPQTCYLSELKNLQWQQTSQAITTFMFTGQGSQYSYMGYELYKNNSIFKQHLLTAANAVNQFCAHDILDIIYTQDQTKAELINQTEFTQPSLFVLEYALAKTWITAGIKPNYVMGHSVGEFAAAVIADAISLETGAALITTRAKLMQQLPAGGTMAALMADATTVTNLIQACKLNLDIAAINHPKQTVISGEINVIKTFIELAKQQKIKGRLLTVSHAFHSNLMEPMLAEFKKFAEDLPMQTPKIPIISNLTGEPLTNLSADYWCEHIRNPVKFQASTLTCSKLGSELFVEIGPNPILINMAQRCVTTDNINWISSLDQKAKNPETINLMKNIGTAFLLGA